MNLGEIRDWFFELSGRGDLVTAAGANAGADKYIQAGTRYLDQMTEHHREIGRVFRLISAGDYFVRFQNCRVIQRVGIATSSEFKGWATKYTLDEIYEDDSYNEPFAEVTRGTPSIYAPAFLRMVGPDDSETEGYIGYMDVMTAWKEYNGVILLPPADQSYHVEVWGKFFSEELSSDSDENLWSINHPEVLVWAAMRELEVSYRNNQGRQDWESAIAGKLYLLERDFVDQSIIDVDQMEG